MMRSKLKIPPESNRLRAQVTQKVGYSWAWLLLPNCCRQKWGLGLRREVKGRGEVGQADETLTERMPSTLEGTSPEKNGTTPRQKYYWLWRLKVPSEKAVSCWLPYREAHQSKSPIDTTSKQLSKDLLIINEWTVKDSRHLRKVYSIKGRQTKNKKIKRTQKKQIQCRKKKKTIETLCLIFSEVLKLSS